MIFELDTVGHKRMEINFDEEVVKIKLLCEDHTLDLHPQAFEKMYGIRHTVCSSVVAILMGYNLMVKKGLSKHVYLYLNFPCQSVHIRQFNKINGVLQPTNHGMSLPPASWLKLFDAMEELKRDKPVFSLPNLCAKVHQSQEEKNACFNCQPDSEEELQEE